MREEPGEAPEGSGSLGELIRKAKEERRMGRFNRMVGSLMNLWFYQYVENFHCKPDSVEDMIGGIKYLMFSRKDK